MPQNGCRGLAVPLESHWPARRPPSSHPPTAGLRSTQLARGRLGSEEMQALCFQPLLHPISPGSRRSEVPGALGPQPFSHALARPWAAAGGGGTGVVDMTRQRRDVDTKKYPRTFHKSPFAPKLMTSAGDLAGDLDLKCSGD